MLGQSHVLKFVLFGVVLFGIGVVVLNLISYNRRQNDFDLTDKNHAIQRLHSLNKPFILPTADFQFNTKPRELNSEIIIPKIHIKTYKLSMNNEEQNILVREAGTGSFNILLLHGQLHSSKIWETIGTLQYLSSWGYRALAIDIPGYENKSLPVTDNKAAIQWLTRLIRTLRLTNLVIISPSTSGRLTLPYILQLNPKQQLIQGFVPIAPVGTKNFDSNVFTHIKIPTLIIYGENDNKFRSSLNILKEIPNNKILIIKNASHACYIDKSNDFHHGLRQFLHSIYRPIFIKNSKRYLKLKDNKSPLRNRTKLLNKQKEKVYGQHIHQ